MKSLLFLGIGIASGLWIANPDRVKAPLTRAKLVNVVISTSQMDQEANFYAKTFGFKAFFHNETSTFLKSGSANLVFVKVADKSAETKQVCLDMGVPDLKVALSSIRDAGVKIDATDPHVLKVNDPDGNLVEIVNGGVEK